MGRLTYVCATCEAFTRRYSAQDTILTIHNNRGEIVSLLEYLVGRSSRRYHASHPFWYRRRREKGIHRFRHDITVADSSRATFLPGRSTIGNTNPNTNKSDIVGRSNKHCHTRYQQQSRIPPRMQVIKHFNLSI